MSNMENGLLTGYFGQPQNFQPNYGLSNAGLQMAQLPAGRGGVAASYDIGQQNLGLFQNAVGQLLNSQGVYSPTQEKERALQGILGCINPQDPNSLADASRKLMGIGLQAEAQQMMEEARKVAESQSKVGKDLAQANYYGAQSQKALTGGDKEFAVDAQLAQLDAALENGLITEEQRKLGYQNVLKANEQLNAANVGRINRSGYNTDVNTMLGLGGTSVQNVGAGLTPEANIPQSDINAMQTALQNRLAGQSKGSGGGTTKEIQNAQMLADLEVKEQNNTLTPVEANTLKNLRTNKMTTVGETAVNKNVEAYDAVNKAMFGLDAAVNSMTGLINSNVKWKSGTLRGMSEYMKAIAGTEDAATIANLRTEAAQIEKQLAALPPGPATDKDMAVAARVRLGQYANPQAMLEDLKYMQEAAKRVKEGVLFKDQYLNTHKNLDGFPTAYEQRFGNKQSVKSGVTSTGVSFRIKE